jgi:uncharacterized membrane-anchored protein YhcB (DUF1043 family)
MSRRRAWLFIGFVIGFLAKRILSQSVPQKPFGRETAQQLKKKEVG